MSIPKIIHQTIRNKNALPEALLQNIANIKKLNEDWDYRLYDDDDIIKFISENYSLNIVANFHSINPLYGAARADFFRYLLMLKVGGVYLDIKSTVTKKLDDVLLKDDTYILSHWVNHKGALYEEYGLFPELSSRGEYQQWHIISAPQHPFLDEVVSTVSQNIETYNASRSGVGHLGVLRTTGPIAYTLAIERIQKHNRFRLVNIEDLGFKYSILATGSDRGAHERFHLGKHFSVLRAPLILPEFRDVAGNVLDLSKMRRNTLCPCGSGKRIKHCHGMTT
jgi:mannosyltransferase OCH1-like enzyme